MTVEYTAYSAHQIGFDLKILRSTFMPRKRIASPLQEDEAQLFKKPNTADSGIIIWSPSTGRIALEVVLLRKVFATGDQSDIESDTMDVCSTTNNCPCGYLHGPGLDPNHDLAAVGFSANLMRGPS